MTGTWRFILVSLLLYTSVKAKNKPNETETRPKKTPGRAELLRKKGTTEGVCVCRGHLKCKVLQIYPIIKVIDIFYSAGILYVKNYLTKRLTGLSLSDGELLCVAGAGDGEE